MMAQARRPLIAGNWKMNGLRASIAELDKVIACAGEQKEERTAGRTLDVVGAQIAGSLPDNATADKLIIAYEPVWAIGTGLTPTPADAAEVHAFIRARLAERFGGGAARMRILYGGSVKASNPKELMAAPDADRALVRGASLQAEGFFAITEVYPRMSSQSAQPS